MRNTLIYFLLPAAVLWAGGCKSLRLHTQPGESTGEPAVAETARDYPLPDREFRAAWVASVANINWPSKPGLSTAEQQEEAVSLLNLLQQNNYNAVILQVRPQADALYESSFEPWSYFLTGEQGKAPDPFYDPLQFWTDEAHKRGLELHAWINPYRAHHTTGGELSDQSVVRTMKDVVVELESGFYWFDPASAVTRQHTLDVVMDIVKRYDIDGIHFDDYFYPYPAYNNEKDFPDSTTWAAYKKEGGTLERAEWRRNAVNTLVEEVYTSIKHEKPWIKFGISPFGIWRPGYPASVKGLDQYSDLYSDAKKWLNEGWVDYLAPQLYWPVNQIEQSFPVLLGWWKSQNIENKYIWPGINAGLFEGEKKADEMISQIMITRGMLPEAPGTLHWSIDALLKNEKLQSGLSELPYKEPALPPPVAKPAKHAITLPEPEIIYNTSDLTVRAEENHASDYSGYMLYARYGSEWMTAFLPRKLQSKTLPFYKIETLNIENGYALNPVSLLEEIKITKIDRFGYESSPVVIHPCIFECITEE